MLLEAHLPTLLTVITTAAIDAINPCAIGVLVLMVSVVLSSGGTRRRLLFLGSLYILAIFTVYLLAGLGLMYFFQNIPLYVSEYIAIAVGVIIAIAGLIEIKDYFWYGRWFSLAIPAAASRKLRGYASHVTVPGVIFLGAFVSAVELPCTGAPYLAIITILSQYFDFSAFIMLVIYNIVFVSPLIVILLLVAAGLNVEKVQTWKNETRSYMRFAAGALLVFLSWLLILIANGAINFG